MVKLILTQPKMDLLNFVLLDLYLDLLIYNFSQVIIKLFSLSHFSKVAIILVFTF